MKSIVTIEELIERANACNRARGHRTGTEVPDLDALLSRLCLIGTEVSEAADLVNKRGMRTRGISAFTISTRASNHRFRKDFGLELADIVIRTIDLADLAGVDLAEALSAKVSINEGRPDRYGTVEEG